MKCSTEGTSMATEIASASELFKTTVHICVVSFACKTLTAMPAGYVVVCMWRTCTSCVCQCYGAVSLTCRVILNPQHICKPPRETRGCNVCSPLTCHSHSSNQRNQTSAADPARPYSGKGMLENSRKHQSAAKCPSGIHHF